MAFRTDTKAINDYELIPEGDYEVIIAKIDEKSSYNGTNTKLNFCLAVRNDVEQNCKNRTLFLEIWKKKNPNDMDIQVSNYNFSHLMNVVKHCGIPDGKEFETVSDLCKELLKKCMRVTVHHEEYKGKTSVKIDQLYGLSDTKFPECKHRFKSVQTSDNFVQKPAETFVSQNNPLDDFEEVISPDDIPF